MPAAQPLHVNSIQTSGAGPDGGGGLGGLGGGLSGGGSGLGGGDKIGAAGLGGGAVVTISISYTAHVLFCGKSLQYPSKHISSAPDPIVGLLSISSEAYEQYF